MDNGITVTVTETSGGAAARTLTRLERRVRRLGYSLEYARRIEQRDHTTGVDHYRFQVPGYQVSTVVTPSRDDLSRGWDVDLFDSLTGDHVAYVSLCNLGDTLADARTHLARYMADNLGAPA